MTILTNEVLLKRLEKIQRRASSFIAAGKVLVYYLALDGTEIERERIRIGNPLMKPVMWKHINEKAKELQPAAIVFIADTYVHHPDKEKTEALLAAAYGPGINLTRSLEYKRVGSKIMPMEAKVLGLDENTGAEWTYLKPWWETASEEAGSVN